MASRQWSTPHLCGPFGRSKYLLIPSLSGNIDVPADVDVVRVSLTLENWDEMGFDRCSGLSVQQGRVRDGSNRSTIPGHPSMSSSHPSVPFQGMRRVKKDSISIDLLRPLISPLSSPSPTSAFDSPPVPVELVLISPFYTSTYTSGLIPFILPELRSYISHSIITQSL